MTDDLPEDVTRMRAARRCLDGGHWIGALQHGEPTSCQCGQIRMDLVMTLVEVPVDDQR